MTLDIPVLDSLDSLTRLTLGLQVLLTCPDHVVDIENSVLYVGSEISNPDKATLLTSLGWFWDKRLHTWCYFIEEDMP